jgi:multidrug efflux pump subunit AcrA (membrane-fusion protein)
MLAEIELENAAHLLQPGSYAQVSLATAQDHSSWTIPANTVSMRVDGPHVAIVNDRDEIELHPITLGRDLGNRVVVIQGIEGNERLVVNPGDGMANGMAVRIRESEQNPELAKR